VRSLLALRVQLTTEPRVEISGRERADPASRRREFFEAARYLALAKEKNSSALILNSSERTPPDPPHPADADPDSRCAEIVEFLHRRGLAHDERLKLILEAEVLPFRGQQAAALVLLLWRFIEEHRESNVPADLVAVGSAIRNYVATATTDEAFAAAASLLQAQGRLPVPLELEVEVTKMVVRKLTANPPPGRDQYSELARRLEELVDAYARPRLLTRETYGAIALNAILGLVLTRSGRDQEVAERMRALGVPWFQQLVARRAARLRSDLIARDSNAKFADTARVLGQLSELESPSHGS